MAKAIESFDRWANRIFLPDKIERWYRKSGQQEEFYYFLRHPEDLFKRVTIPIPFTPFVIQVGKGKPAFGIALAIPGTGLTIGVIAGHDMKPEWSIGVKGVDIGSYQVGASINWPGSQVAKGTASITINKIPTKKLPDPVKLNVGWKKGDFSIGVSKTGKSLYLTVPKEGQPFVNFDYKYEGGKVYIRTGKTGQWKFYAGREISFGKDKEWKIDVGAEFARDLPPKVLLNFIPPEKKGKLNPVREFKVTYDPKKGTATIDMKTNINIPLAVTIGKKTDFKITVEDILKKLEAPMYQIMGAPIKEAIRWSIGDKAIPEGVRNFLEQELPGISKYVLPEVTYKEVEKYFKSAEDRMKGWMVDMVTESRYFKLKPIEEQRLLTNLNLGEYDLLEKYISGEVGFDDYIASLYLNLDKVGDNLRTFLNEDYTNFLKTNEDPRLEEWKSIEAAPAETWLDKFKNFISQDISKLPEWLGEVKKNIEDIPWIQNFRNEIIAETKIVSAGIKRLALDVGTSIRDFRINLLDEIDREEKVVPPWTQWILGISKKILEPLSVKTEPPWPEQYKYEGILRKYAEEMHLAPFDIWASQTKEGLNRLRSWDVANIEDLADEALEATDWLVPAVKKEVQAAIRGYRDQKIREVKEEYESRKDAIEFTKLYQDLEDFEKYRNVVYEAQDILSGKDLAGDLGSKLKQVKLPTKTALREIVVNAIANYALTRKQATIQQMREYDALKKSIAEYQESLDYFDRIRAWAPDVAEEQYQKILTTLNYAKRNLYKLSGEIAQATTGDVEKFTEEIARALNVPNYQIAEATQWAVLNRIKPEIFETVTKETRDAWLAAELFKVGQAEAKKKIGPISRFEIEEPVSYQDLPGVGDKTAEALKKGGFDSITKISAATPKELSAAVEGMTETRADKLITNAKAFVREKALSVDEILADAQQRIIPVEKFPVLPAEPFVTKSQLDLFVQRIKEASAEIIDNISDFIGGTSRDLVVKAVIDIKSDLVKDARKKYTKEVEKGLMYTEAERDAATAQLKTAVAERADWLSATTMEHWREFFDPTLVEKDEKRPVTVALLALAAAKAEAYKKVGKTEWDRFLQTDYGQSLLTYENDLVSAFQQTQNETTKYLDELTWELDRIKREAPDAAEAIADYANEIAGVKASTNVISDFLDYYREIGLPNRVTATQIKALYNRYKNTEQHKVPVTKLTDTGEVTSGLEIGVFPKSAQFENRLTEFFSFEKTYPKSEYAATEQYFERQYSEIHKAYETGKSRALAWAYFLAK